MKIVYIFLKRQKSARLKKQVNADFRYKNLICVGKLINIYVDFKKYYKPNSFNQIFVIFLAFSIVSISQKTLINGSVPENLAMIQPPFLK